MHTSGITRVLSLGLKGLAIVAVSCGDVCSAGDEIQPRGVPIFRAAFVQPKQPDVADEALYDPPRQPAPNLQVQWIRQFGSETDNHLQGLSMARGGDLLLSGYTSGAIFEPKKPRRSDVFAVKFRADGEVVWGRQWESSLNYGIGCDAQGNAYLAGWELFKLNADGEEAWRREITFWGGYTVATALTVTSNGALHIAGWTDQGVFGPLSPQRGASRPNDYFVAKYDSKGKLLWGRQRGNGYRMPASAIAVDAGDNIYVTGRTDDGTRGIVSGYGDGYVSKHSPEGELLWTRTFSTRHLDSPQAIVAGGDGDVYVAGSSGGNLLDPHSDPLASRRTFGFLIKYAGDGTRLWTRLTLDGRDSRNSAVVMDEAGDLYVTGHTDRLFVAKYNAEGALLWRWQWPNITAQSASRLAIDRSGAIYVAGETSRPLAGEQKGRVDLFVAKLAPAEK